MNEVIFLSDVIIHGELGNSRYMGPYVLASEVNQAGIKSIVIDYFTRLENPHAYLENFLSKDTLAICISSTFLTPFFSRREQFQLKNRSAGRSRYDSGELWIENAAEFSNWISYLKDVIYKYNPKCKLILGGTKAVNALYRPSVYKNFDYVCIGAGDGVLLECIQKLKASQEVSYLEKNGVKFLKSKGSLIKTEICPDVVWNKNFGVQYHESLPIEIARGCKFNCKYCHYEKKSTIRKDPKVLRQELIRNYDANGTDTYLLCDDCFNDSREKVETICGVFKSLPFKVNWVGYARADVAVKFPYTLDLMVESGARGIFWGLESFNDPVSRKIGKGTPSKDVKEFLLSFKKNYGDVCISEGSFIAGLPGESRESLMETQQWLLENDALHWAQMGPLGIQYYNPTLDGAAIDYADFSRNPTKYGFTEVSFKPYYWKHETMDSVEAEEFATQFHVEWNLKKQIGIVGTMWFFAHLSTLGYRDEQIWEIMFKEKNRDFWLNDVASRFDSYRKKYHSELLESFGSRSPIIS